MINKSEIKQGYRYRKDFYFMFPVGSKHQGYYLKISAFSKDEAMDELKSVKVPAFNLEDFSSIKKYGLKEITLDRLEILENESKS